MAENRNSNQLRLNLDVYLNGTVSPTEEPEEQEDEYDNWQEESRKRVPFRFTGDNRRMQLPRVSMSHREPRETPHRTPRQSLQKTSIESRKEDAVSFGTRIRNNPKSEKRTDGQPLTFPRLGVTDRSPAQCRNDSKPTPRQLWSNKKSATKPPLGVSADGGETKIEASRSMLYYQHVATGLQISVPLKVVKRLKNFFTRLDTDESGVVDVAEVDAYAYDITSKGGGSHQGTYSPAATILAANFPGHFGGELVRRIENVIRDKEGLTFPDMLSVAFPNARDVDIAVFVDAVKDKEQDWELLANPALVEKKRHMADIEREGWKTWIDNLWNRYDMDKSGELDEREFKLVLRELGGTAEDAEIFFKEVDVDLSGSISKQEFRDWWIGQGAFASSSIIGAGSLDPEMTATQTRIQDAKTKPKKTILGRRSHTIRAEPLTSASTRADSKTRLLPPIQRGQYTRPSPQL